MDRLRVSSCHKIGTGKVGHGMNGNTFSFSFLVLTLAALGGCASKPPATESNKARNAWDKIQGKAQVEVLLQPTPADSPLNAGGPSVYLWEGVRRYRLFLKTPVEVVAGKEYMAEGVYAQKVIDEMGDPDQGKNGYALPASCERVVNMAWPGLAFDVTGGHASVLPSPVKRYTPRAEVLPSRQEPVAFQNRARCPETAGG